MRKYAVGIDSVDSLFGGCTTHFTVFLIKKLLSRGLNLLDLPHLVRLNQFIPWKTRGNASVGLLLGAEGSGLSAPFLLREVVNTIERYGGAMLRSEPGVAVLEINEEGEEVYQKLYGFYKKSLVDYVSKPYLTGILKERGIAAWGGRGVIGAVSAIGYLLGGAQHTYELIAYRKPENVGKRRLIDEESLKEIEVKSEGKIFNNYDYENGRTVAAPRGPDPVLLGIRGVDPQMLLEFAGEVRLNEPPSFWMLFATNQHLDEHFRHMKICALRPYGSGYVEGVVESNPVVHKKGHVELKLRDETGSLIVFFFAPTSPMNKVAMMLRVGDYIGVLGGAKPSDNSIIFEAHKLWVLESPMYAEVVNPVCPNCNSRLKSDGRIGLKCPRCGLRVNRKFKELLLRGPRELEGVYTPPPGRINHLVKPSWANVSDIAVSYDFEKILSKLNELNEEYLNNFFNPLNNS